MLGRADAILRRVEKLKKPRVTEIGVWKGKLSKELLKNHEGLYLTMVDLWDKHDPESDYLRGDSQIAKSTKEEFLEARRQAMEAVFPYTSRCVVHCNNSVDVASMYPDNYFDLVFIDGDHSYEGCIEDIRAWWSKVRIEGYIGGHDYDHPDQGEVKKAVDEFFGKYYVVELDLNRTWFVRKF
jgi:hypothetical protein